MNLVLIDFLLNFWQRSFLPLRWNLGTLPYAAGGLQVAHIRQNLCAGTGLTSDWPL